MTDMHDRVVEHIAATRFPFPDQTDWPADYQTLTNAGGHNCPVVADGVTYYPDIVILDGANQVAELGDVEIDLRPERATRWSALSQLCKRSSTGARSFFVYVPAGLDARARELLETHGVSYTGVRSYAFDADGHVSVTPIVTPGDAKDHR
jgi:hypothetical protein